MKITDYLIPRRSTDRLVQLVAMFAHSHNLLAFGFASPALLGWLALAAVPVLIHWLYRRRYREVTWAAMQFLVEAARKQSRRTRLEQLLLLVTRVLILALMVLAFARPRWADANKLSSEVPPTLRVIVLDSSLSMGRKTAREDVNVAGSTLFEVGKSIAREIVSQSRSGDRFVLVRIAGSEPRMLIRQPTLVSRAVLDEIERLPLTFESGDVAATMRHFSELFAAKQPHERCEVVVISDFQADNWTVGQISNLPGLNRQAENLPHKFVLIDVGAATPENGAIVGLTTDPPILANEQSMSVTATLRNAGAVPLTARRVELRIDEQLVDSQRVDLPLGQDATVVFTLMAPASGEHSLSVRLEEDSLAADNERWLPLTVRSELSVLLVNGRPSARPRDAATFFVEQALSPKAPGSLTSSRWLRVNAIPDSDLPHVEFTRYDVIFVCDVGKLTESDVERLRRFAEDGGGVIVSLGPTVAIEDLNEIAFGPHGLLTIRLGERVTSTKTDGTTSAFGFDPADFSHPLLHEFRGNPGAGLETALIRQYVRVDVADASRVRVDSSGSRRTSHDVALQFSTGDPAIVTQPLGRGRCVLVTTSLDVTWGEWAIWAAGFVPLIHELTEYAATGNMQAREILVGESIQRDVPTGLAFVTLTAPGGIERTLTPIDRDGQSLIVVNELLRPGNFSLSSSHVPRLTERFAVNVDPRESEPRRIAPRELFVSRGEDSAERVVVRDTSSPTPTPQKNIGSESLAMELLAIVLVLLLVEQTLAWRFTAGAAVAIVSVFLVAAWSLLLFF